MTSEDDDSAARWLAWLPRRWLLASGSQHRTIDRRRSHLRAKCTVVPSGHERIDRQLPCLLVRGELESLHQKRSQHQLPWPWWRARRSERNVAVGLGHDVKAFRGNPSGSADESRVRQLISVANDSEHRHIGRNKPSARLKLHRRLAYRYVPFDRRDFKCGGACVNRW